MARPKSSTTTDWFPKDDALCIQTYLEKNKLVEDDSNINEILEEAHSYYKVLVNKINVMIN